MALFGRSSIDDPALKRLVGRDRVLASARTPQGQVLGLADRLIHPEGSGWAQLPWHEIATGTWDRDTRVLRWTTVDGGTASLPLGEIGQLPDLFNERVTASIACLRTVDLAKGGQAVITARRDLGNPVAPLIWRVTAGKGVQQAMIEDDPLVARELDRLRAEYDLG